MKRREKCAAFGAGMTERPTLRCSRAVRLDVGLANPFPTQEQLYAKPPHAPVSVLRSLRRTSLRRLLVESSAGPVH
jgi:hypothetical protein